MPLWYNLMEGVLKYHIYMLFYICVMKLYHCYMSDLQKMKEAELAKEREEKAANGEDDKKESLPPIVCIFKHSLFTANPLH